MRGQASGILRTRTLQRGGVEAATRGILQNHVLNSVEFIAGFHHRVADQSRLLSRDCVSRIAVQEKGRPDLIKVQAYDWRRGRSYHHAVVILREALRLRKRLLSSNLV